MCEQRTTERDPILGQLRHHMPDLLWLVILARRRPERSGGRSRTWLARVPHLRLPRLVPEERESHPRPAPDCVAVDHGRLAGYSARLWAEKGEHSVLKASALHTARRPED